MQLIAVEVFIYLLFDYKALFICVKDKTCLRMLNQSIGSAFLGQFW